VQDEAATLKVDGLGTQARLRAPKFALEVVKGHDRGRPANAVDGKLTVGTGEGVDLKLDDPTVSRFHAEFFATEQGIVLRDLGSTNGTRLGTIEVREALLKADVEVSFGHTLARFSLQGEHTEIATSARTSFGEMVGACPAIRRVFTLLERAAPTTAPVLITGESGTGKEVAARALHGASDRQDKPFVVVDCGGLPPTLIESELFGHEKGAFTGAVRRREGAFERAEGGTVFLDELGELPVDFQPKLLRVLGENEIRPIGSSKTRPIDVRIVGATNRDLRREINAGNFRADLFFRLAVIQVPLPPLRERLDDLPLLVRRLLERIASERAVDAIIDLDPSVTEALSRHHWPGNIRELRNYLEQLVILRAAPTLPDPTGDGVLGSTSNGASFADLHQLPWRTAKNRLIERFERDYLAHLLDQTAGNVAEAARRAGVDRGTLFRSIRRHGIKVER